MFMTFLACLICLHDLIRNVITRIVFGEDIFIGPLLIPSLIDLVRLMACVVVHGRDYVEVVI